MIHYLNVKTLIYINYLVIKNANEHYLGIHYHNELKSIIEQPKLNLTSLGLNPYPTIWLKAAYILQKITKKHVFVDGNKRTAFISTKVFLGMNGYHLNIKENVGINFMVRVAKHRDTKFEMQYIAKLLKQHSYKIKNF